MAFETSCSKALGRIGGVVAQARAYSAIWAYLRPLEILEAELQQCAPNDTVELDVTGLWAWSGDLDERIRRGPELFAEMLSDANGEIEHDMALLNRLVYGLSTAADGSVSDLDSEVKMFVLIGTYEGEDPTGEPYPLEFFSDEYWVRTLRDFT